MIKLISDLIEKYSNLATVYTCDVVEDLKSIRQHYLIETVPQEIKKPINELRDEYKAKNPVQKQVPPIYWNNYDWILAKINKF